MNINVGDYVRNKKGIGKIIDIKDHGELVEIILDDFQDVIEYPNGNEAGTLRNKIVMRKGIMREDIKIGKLIDLIEVGDYVNGEKILEITEREKTPDMKKYFLTSRSIDYGVRLSEDELNSVIESIVTKEQFEEMQYVVK